MDEQQARLDELRRRREQLTASGDDAGAHALDEEIAEAEHESLTGSGQPRTNTLEGRSAALYVAAMMRHGAQGVNAARIRRDALDGGRRALSRLRLASLRFARPITATAHARMSLPPRRPGRVRAQRGPARAAPALPRPAGAA